MFLKGDGPGEERGHLENPPPKGMEGTFNKRKRVSKFERVKYLDRLAESRADYM